MSNPAGQAGPGLGFGIRARAGKSVRWSKSSRSIRITAVGWAALLVGLGLTAQLSDDEHMYVAAGVLLRDHALYRDFAYVQAPYLPYIYRALFDSLPGGRLLLTARMFSLACGLGCLALIWLVSRCASVPSPVATAITALFASHHVFLFVLPYARNHVPALLLSLAAVLLALHAAQRQKGAYWHTMAGIAAGLAVGVRLTHAPLTLALLAAAPLAPTGLSFLQRVRRVR